MRQGLQNFQQPLPFDGPSRDGQAVEVVEQMRPDGPAYHRGRRRSTSAADDGAAQTLRDPVECGDGGQYHQDQKTDLLPLQHADLLG